MRVREGVPSLLQKMASSKSKASLREARRSSQSRGAGKVLRRTMTMSARLACRSMSMIACGPPEAVTWDGAKPAARHSGKNCRAR
jgi:hypothetical protein